MTALRPTFRRAMVALVLLLPTAAVADPLATTVVGVRQIGKQTYLVDRKGNTVGAVRELAPGNFHVLDAKGATVQTIQVPKGCLPFMPCPGR